MRLNSAVIVSLLILLIGFFLDKPYLWFPSSVLLAAIISLFTSKWINSNKIGTSTSVSTVSKFLLSLIGFYSTLGQFGCIGLLIHWFIF